MTYTYYLQTITQGKEQVRSLRRYPDDKEDGERWDPALEKWTQHCAPRQACVQTRDRVISNLEAEALTK